MVFIIDADWVLQQDLVSDKLLDPNSGLLRRKKRGSLLPWVRSCLVFVLSAEALGG
jgi:hypothetical protein